VGVDEVGLKLVDELVDAARGEAHLRNEPGALGRQRAVKAQAISLFHLDCREALLRRGQVKRLPAQRALLAQDGRGAEGVAAMQREGVVEDVEDAHAEPWSSQP